MKVNTLYRQRWIKLKILFLLLLFYPVLVISQNQTDSLAQLKDDNGSLLVFIDYSESDNTEKYLRSEIPFVTYARDPQLAQLHILIVDQRTASGGKKFSISFIGKEKYEGFAQTLEYISLQSDTEDQWREGLAKTIKMGLMPYVSQTRLIDQIDIQYDDEKMKKEQTSISDGWDYWIFSIDLGGGVRAEESRDDYNIWSSLRANRITEAWKIQNQFDYNYVEENFIDDDVAHTSFLKSWKMESEVIKSLGSRWSAGVYAEARSTTFLNLRFGWDIAPALGFNFFPWSESQRRQFAISYRVGYRSMKYLQVTLYDRISDNLLYHAMELEWEMIQPWGKLDFEIDASQYIELKDYYSIKFDVELDFRVTSNLELVLNSKIESIHDQIFLPRGDATIDEILLRRRQLATTYDVQLKAGFRFTFGSIYNNIINERM